MNDLKKQYTKIMIKELNNIDTIDDIKTILGRLAVAPKTRTKTISFFDDSSLLQHMYHLIVIVDDILAKNNYPSKIDDLCHIFFLLSDANQKLPEAGFSADENNPVLFGINDGNSVKRCSPKELHKHIVNNFAIMNKILKKAVRNEDYCLINSILDLDFLVMLSFIDFYEDAKKKDRF